MSEAADQLDVIHDLLLTEGWTQGSFCDRSGARCLIGAAVHTDGYLGLDEICRYLARHGMASPRVVAPIAEWNDRPERTLDEVLDMLRHAAKEVRNDA